MFEVVKVRASDGEFMELHCREEDRDEADLVASMKNEDEDSPFIWLVRTQPTENTPESLTR